VPIGSLTVGFHIESGLSSALSGTNSCYVGASKSTELCTLVKTDDGYTVTATGLTSYQNVTIAIGFQPQTFTPYKATLVERAVSIWSISSNLAFVPALLLMFIFQIRYARKSGRRSELSTIVPEYLPPKDASVTVSASIYKSTAASFSAQLIDLAVRHYIKIYQTREKSLFLKAKYELEIVKDISDLRDEEQELLRDIFPSTATGSRLNMEDMKKNRIAISLKMSDNPKKLNASIRGSYGIRAKDADQSAWFKRAGFIILIVAVLTFSYWLFVAAIVSFVYAYMLWPLTDKGLALYRYLEGLKMYIKVAEKDRIKMLQSPEGAEKIDVSVDVNDPRQLVKLYERVLPYAILFGQEKDWNKQLGQYYEASNQSPDWYQGNNMIFNAAIFSSAMNSFNTAATYSSPTSSTSGGSGGGGFSGGGGGGGGGGGW